MLAYVDTLVYVGVSWNTLVYVGTLASFEIRWLKWNTLCMPMFQRTPTFPKYGVGQVSIKHVYLLAPSL